MKLFPCAKINLGLNVVSKRPDGYHDLETVFYPVDIHDEMDVTLSDTPGCQLEVLGCAELCPPEKNLVVKAYNLISQHYQLPGIKVTLTKNLPSQAGMGGGSSDGAYMIRAINELCSLGMSTEDMQDFAIQLGADCPFFITSQTAYAEGKGEVLTPFASNDSVLKDEYFLVLIKPDVAVSTKEAYAGINPHAPKFNCKDIVQNTPITQWRDTLHNDFEDSIFLKLPILGEVKQALYDSGAVYASMSGSGSTIYGIFPNSTNEIELKENSKITQYASKYYFKILKKK